MSVRTGATFLLENMRMVLKVSRHNFDYCRSKGLPGDLTPSERGRKRAGQHPAVQDFSFQNSKLRPSSNVIHRNLHCRSELEKP
jgi:hypothetical protein